MAEEAREIVDAALFEKIALVALVSLIFAQVLPDVQASTLQLAIGVAVIVTVNTALSHWLARRGVGLIPATQHFVAMAGVNAGYCSRSSPWCYPAWVGRSALAARSSLSSC